MSAEIYRRFGVEPLINAAGKMTALGGTAQADAVAQAQAAAAQAHIDMGLLRMRAGEQIAAYTGAAAASVTTGAAAGIAISVAACITGTDLARVKDIPNADGLPRRVLLQAGHDVDFGASVTQMIRLGGGQPHVLGRIDSVPATLLQQTLQRFDDIVAMLFVQSHHSVQDQMILLDDCIALCRERGVPVIVDAAAEEDLRRYIALGADLVTYSGGKAFGGPTAGFIAGRRDLIDACELQQRGVARAMKVGKEQIIGLLVALDIYVNRDADSEDARRSSIVEALQRELRNVAGLHVTQMPDEAGRGIVRLALRRADGGDIRKLAAHLASGTPSVRTRNHHLDDGYLLIDPREIDTRHVAAIVERICRFFQEAADRDAGAR